MQWAHKVHVQEDVPHYLVVRVDESLSSGNVVFVKQDKISKSCLLVTVSSAGGVKSIPAQPYVVEAYVMEACRNLE